MAFFNAGNFLRLISTKYETEGDVNIPSVNVEDGLVFIDDVARYESQEERAVSEFTAPLTAPGAAGVVAAEVQVADFIPPGHDLQNVYLSSLFLGVDSAAAASIISLSFGWKSVQQLSASNPTELCVAILDGSIRIALGNHYFVNSTAEFTNNMGSTGPRLIPCSDRQRSAGGPTLIIVGNYSAGGGSDAVAAGVLYSAPLGVSPFGPRG